LLNVTIHAPPLTCVKACGWQVGCYENYILTAEKQVCYNFNVFCSQYETGLISYEKIVFQKRLGFIFNFRLISLKGMWFPRRELHTFLFILYSFGKVEA